MAMKGKTTIFVSENGTGKTTILNAIRFTFRTRHCKPDED
ncbi:MAG: hypothetical protein KJJ56_10745 [Serratia rubidaea]|nr:hypothetical protein [Serratia rubidaea]